MFTRVEAGPDHALVASITPDVMKCLGRSGFFERLDDLPCPKDGSRPREGCCGDSKLSESILRASGFDSSDLTDIVNVLRSQGGCWDCEILYKVAESSRLPRAGYIDVNRCKILERGRAQCVRAGAGALRGGAEALSAREGASTITMERSLMDG